MRHLAREHTLFRLENAPYRSRTTDAAMQLILRNLSEAALIQNLSDPSTAPVALEAFSAMQTESEGVFEAVQSTISNDLCMSWALFDSLHRLPWYGGIRAFLTLPDRPQSSPCAYAFFILARNKIFIPPHTSGDPFDRCFRAMWRLISTAKTGNWRTPDDGIVTVMEMIETHLSRPHPDEFVVYFAALVLSQMGPIDLAMQNLQDYTGQNAHPVIRRVATLTLRHLESCLPSAMQQGQTVRTAQSKRGQRPSGIVMRMAAMPVSIGIILTGAVSGLFGRTQNHR